ncbi:DUF2231 domain-containing protein [Marinobacter caseinilyticus]|uniref:DUF2231 domain-containing protein n=1 Tax=Marinobacter caseinilyticus TaxID=2692195 RepID=UPI00140D81B6|nr:DUF2231 domain-containing protein [Marinobacter caseinilyticus]
MGKFLPRRFLGLPLHPMLVHFPLAFWLSVPVFDALALSLSLWPWWGLALGATAVGVIFGAFALITGLLDYIELSETDSNDVRLAARHGVRTSVVWTVMTMKLMVAGLTETQPLLVAGSLVIDVLVSALLLQGAFFGTKITYGHYRDKP